MFGPGPLDSYDKVLLIWGFLWRRGAVDNSSHHCGGTGRGVPIEDLQGLNLAAQGIEGEMGERISDGHGGLTLYRISMLKGEELMGGIRYPGFCARLN